MPLYKTLYIGNYRRNEFNINSILPQSRQLEELHRDEFIYIKQHMSAHLFLFNLKNRQVLTI